MKYAYAMLTNGNAGDWGQCLLVDQALGEVIKGEKEVKELPTELLYFLIKGQSLTSKEDLVDFSDKDFDNLADEIYDKNSYDNYIYSSLSNAIHEHKSPYIIEFEDIAKMANYVRENNIIVLDTLL